MSDSDPNTDEKVIDDLIDELGLKNKSISDSPKAIEDYRATIIIEILGIFLWYSNFEPGYKHLKECDGIITNLDLILQEFRFSPKIEYFTLRLLLNLVKNKIWKWTAIIDMKGLNSSFIGTFESNLSVDKNSNIYTKCELILYESNTSSLRRFIFSQKDLIKSLVYYLTWHDHSNTPLISIKTVTILAYTLSILNKIDNKVCERLSKR